LNKIFRICPRDIIIFASISVFVLNRMLHLYPRDVIIFALIFVIILNRIFLLYSVYLDILVFVSVIKLSGILHIYSDGHDHLALIFLVVLFLCSLDPYISAFVSAIFLNRILLICVYSRNLNTFASMPLVVLKNILHVRLRDLGTLAVISVIFVWCPLVLDDQIASRILTMLFFSYLC
jgi:hypothetical protein